MDASVNELIHFPQWLVTSSDSTGGANVVNRTHDGPKLNASPYVLFYYCSTRNRQAKMVQIMGVCSIGSTRPMWISAAVIFGWGYFCCCDIGNVILLLL